ncbi:MAG: phosphatase PAP2 family protein [Planctomycetes bacterium]|nr:phosphatase PAP2 family protein [Planctomycetota bacterium]MBL7145653.1 phosphatase PAP2 family protein [Phycisphaerae bacterium]
MSDNDQLKLSGDDLIQKTSKKQWISFSIVFLISWSISLFLWFQVEADRHILFALNNSNFGNGLLIINRLSSQYGMPVIVFIYMLYLALSLKYTHLKKSRQVFLLIIFSFAVAGISGDILKEIFNRTRPIHEYANELSFFTRSGSPSMPSGHSTKSMALALPFLFYAEYKGRFHTLVKCILVFVALMVCFSRIFLGAHYLSDVLAGIGWVFLCLPVSVMLSNKLLRKMTYQKFERAAKIWILVYLGFMIYLVFV